MKINLNLIRRSASGGGFSSEGKKKKVDVNEKQKEQIKT